LKKSEVWGMDNGFTEDVIENNNTKDSPFQAGQDNFERLFREKGVYVDKTGFIHDMITNSRSTIPYFLARPRRFGKTLLLDTIQNIFEGKRELFSGLEIEKRLGDVWEKFPVIRLSMNTTISDPSRFERSLLDTIKRTARALEINLDSDNPSAAISDLISCLSLSHNFAHPRNGSNLILDDLRQCVVLLTDEYDFPLIGNIGQHTNLETIRITLREFYSSIKGCLKFLRFVFITGITKFRQLSVFSGLNNARDISLNEKYAAICGFTIDEIKSSFGKYLEPMLTVLKKNEVMGKNSTAEDLMNELLKWYDGYSWDGITQVLNPFSVMSFFDSKIFRTFWYDSGAPLLTSKIAQNNADYFKVFNRDLSFTPPFPEIDLRYMNDTVVLMQAGYLTIGSIKNPGSNPEYMLKIPNNEIYQSIRLEILERLMVPPPKADNPGKYLNQNYQDFLEAFSSRNSEECERLLSAILAGIVQCDSTAPNEFLFRALLQLLIEFGNKMVLPECPSDIGRSDLAIMTPNGERVIIEIKHEYPHTRRRDAAVSNAVTDRYGSIESGKRSRYVNKKLENLIEKAFNQIAEKNYTKKFLASRSGIYAAAVAIYGTSHVMVRFKRVIWKGERKK
jgi:hypothetical protein